MSVLKIGDRVELEIEKLIYGGSALGRYEGQVVFVDFGAPEDRLEVEITQTKKNFVRAKIVRVIKPSRFRIEPKCPVFKTCGGCQWQHVVYAHQIETKQNILSDVVRRHCPEALSSLGEFWPSPNSYEYRNRIQLKVSGNQVGFYESGTHKIVPIEHCNIAEKSINDEIRNLLNKKIEDGQIRIQRGLDGRIHSYQVKKGEEPLGFAQINSAQNELLQTKIIEQYLNYIGTTIIDLYGGYGNFSLPLARKYKSVKIECVEWNRKAVAEGIKIGSLEVLSNLKFICSDVEQYLKRILLPKDSFVIIDPPREGCSGQVLSELVANKPKLLIYISCDPMTWGRDVQQFITSARQQAVQYRIATIHGLDMFPQTDHIEVFSVFERIE